MVLVNTLNHLNKLFHFLFIHHEKEEVSISDRVNFVFASLEVSSVSSDVNGIVFSITFISINRFVELSELSVILLIVNALDIQSFSSTFITSREGKEQVLLMSV